MSKGRQVLYDQSLICPCKGHQTNHLSNCKNCGGTGYIYVNPKETRMIIQGIDVTTQIQPWSEELRGMMRVTALAEEKMAYMDRIRVIDGSTSFHNEVLFFTNEDDKIFSLTNYDIQHISYIGLWNNSTDPLERLVANEDYIIDKNVLTLNYEKFNIRDIDSLKLTVRYEYFPIFHIMEFKRENFQSFKVQGGKEVAQQLPTSAYARRAHYQLDAKDASGNGLNNNSYTL